METCSCGACKWYRDDWLFVVIVGDGGPSIGGQRKDTWATQHVCAFCPQCGDKLLPGGTVESRANTSANRSRRLAALVDARGCGR